MPVKYLSQEWIDEYNAVLAKDAAVHAALTGKNTAIQMVISDSPQGEIHYWLRIADGGAWASLGDLDGPEVTIRQSTRLGPAQQGRTGRAEGIHARQG